MVSIKGALQTRAVWTQDDLNKIYKVNPRVVESKVGDSTNIKKTIVEYRANPQNSAVAEFGLVNKVLIYDGIGGTLLKEATTDYNLDAAYTSRRIIGLPQEQRLYDGSHNLMSLMTYAYDADGFTGTEQNIPSVIRHDNTNYGANFISGRGNISSVTRCDVTQSGSGCGGGISSQTKYNTAGGVVAQISPGSQPNTFRQTGISYVDEFSDTTTPRNTYAYPTKVIDPAGNFSKVKYRFDTGDSIWTESPAPAGQTQGKVSERLFDAFGRIERENTLSNGSYVRYVYSSTQTMLTSYTTLVDGQGETKAESYTDGAGRLIKSRTAFLWSGASVATWSGQLTEYDILGQQKRQTPPTEITDAWQPTNEDNRGANAWLWTNQSYDWKGRTMQVTNPDGTTKEIDYEGCGCAGSAVTTEKGEEIIEKDWQGNPTNNLGRRNQRSYADVLGRTYKSEILNWDGTIYSTTVNTLNGRDQVINSRQYGGAEGSSVFQDTVLNYDGYGRITNQHTPEQNVGAVTVFEYFNDDQLKKKTDARGAASNYLYDERGLVTQVSYEVPSNITSPPYINSADKFSSNFQIKLTGGNFDTDVQVKIGHISGPTSSPVYDNGTIYTGTQLTWGNGTLTLDYSPAITPNMYIQVINPGQNKESEKVISRSFGSTWGFTGGGNLYDIPQTPTVNFEYDAVGNRKKMNDGLGWVDYKYDPSSRLISENRHFNDITNASSSDGSYKLSYEYALSGGLKSITDPFNARINYNQNRSGQTTAVTGTVAFANQTNYATELGYRAWGAGKHLKFGDDSTMDVNYNTRLSPSQYNLSNAAGTHLMEATYKYWGDGQIQFVDDAGNDRFDRKYDYDQAGRLTLSASGAAANSNSSGGGPYGLTFGYNAFGNLTERSNTYWYSNNQAGFTSAYVNNRNQSADWVYDANGQAISSRKEITTQQGPFSFTSWNYTYFKYDAAGQLVNSDGRQDGNGLETKRTNAYFVRSSVLGGAVVSQVFGEIGEPAFSGRKVSTYVFLEGQVIAEQKVNVADQSESIQWKQRDPLITSVYSNGQQLALDPNGISTDNPNPSTLSQYPSYYSQMYNSSNYGYNSYNPGQGSGGTSGSPYSYGGGVGGTPGNPQVCNLEGGNIPCDQVTSHMAAQCPNNDCGPRRLTVHVPYSPDPDYKSTKSGFFFFTPYANGTIGYKGTLRTEFFAREDDGSVISGGHAVWYNEIFLEFSNIDSYWTFRKNDPVPSGGSRGQLVVSSGVNPCAGYSLNYDASNKTGWGHIVDRHIDQTPAYINRKSVYGRGILTTPTLNSRKRRTSAINYLTFINGGLTIQTAPNGYNTYVYVLGLPDFNIRGKVQGFVVGKDNETSGHRGEYTNLNTLVIGDDCSVVFTSHPGLPNSDTTPNPNVNGSQKWWNPTWVLPL